MNADGTPSHTLSSEEDRSLVWKGQPAWSEYLFLWFVASVSALRALLIFSTEDPGSGLIYTFGVGLFIGLALFLRRTSRYAVTRAAVHRAAGILGQTEKIVPLKKIASASVEQGPLDSLFGIGTILLHLKEGERSEPLRGIRDPDVVCRKIEALL